MIVPVEDMRELGSTASLSQPVLADGSEMDIGTEHGARSIWPSIYPEILRLVEAHRSTIVFVNNRRLAERLALRLNELAEREIARAHHGSLAREQRVLVEEDLKAGRIPCLVATSSLELGIDMGAVDLVIQVESPKSVARGLQRIGRAGHELGAVSKGRIFPKFRADLLESAVVARAMRNGRDRGDGDSAQPARRAGAAGRRDRGRRGDRVDDLHALVTRAYPFRDLSRAQLENVLDMLAGPVSVGRVRRAAAAHRLGSHRRPDSRARRRAPARRHERRHDSRPRALRGLPRRRRRPGRGARRGDGVRGARGPDVPARRLDVADRGDHTRPRARLAGARACQERCRSGRARASAGRTSWARRSARRRASWSALSDAKAARGFATTTTSTSAPRRTCSRSCASSSDATGAVPSRPDDRRRAVP